jgi:hypothetical protein
LRLVSRSTPAEIAAQQVAAGLNKAIAESLQFTGQEISPERRKRHAKKGIVLTKERPKARKQACTLKRTHDVDVAKHHLVACDVKMDQLTISGSADCIKLISLVVRYLAT